MAWKFQLECFNVNVSMWMFKTPEFCSPESVANQTKSTALHIESDWCRRFHCLEPVSLKPFQLQELITRCFTKNLMSVWCFSFVTSFFCRELHAFMRITKLTIEKFMNIWYSIVVKHFYRPDASTKWAPNFGIQRAICPRSTNCLLLIDSMASVWSQGLAFF